MPRKKQVISDQTAYYKSRLNDFISFFNTRLPKEGQIAMQHVADAINAKRQTMYDWNDPTHTFFDPDMQIAARLARYCNAKAGELSIEGWVKLQPQDMIIVYHMDKRGNLIEGFQLAPALQ
jgi:hypothetical protein